MDVLSLLEADHETARTLLRRLQDAKGREARNLLARVKAELDVHTKVEEEIVYPAYRRAVGDKVLVHESLTEHHLVDQVLADMQDLRPDSAEFQGKATVLKELVEHHAEDEEEEMFPAFKKKASKDLLRRLGMQVEERKQELRRNARTRSQLYEEAKRRNIKGRASMSKEELQRALQ